MKTKTQFSTSGSVNLHLWPWDVACLRRFAVKEILTSSTCKGRERNFSKVTKIRENQRLVPLKKLKLDTLSVSANGITSIRRFADIRRSIEFDPSYYQFISSWNFPVRWKFLRAGMQPRQEDARRSNVGALTENKARTFAFRFVLNIKTALRTTGSKWHTYSTSTRFQTHLCPWRHAADRGLSLYANTHCVTRRPSTGDRMPSSLFLSLSPSISPCPLLGRIQPWNSPPCAFT